MNPAVTAVAIDAAITEVWRACAAGRITEAEAAQQDAALRGQQNSIVRASEGPLRPIAVPRQMRRFRSRRYQPSPDRTASRQRRRMLGGQADMPPNVRCHYTEGERAVLTVIAGEVRDHGHCDLAVDAIAAKAGVARTTVHNARREAVRRGHIIFRERRIPGDKSKTNVIHIVSGEWLSWLKRGPGCKIKIASKISYSTRSQSRTQIDPIPVERLHGMRLKCG